jgi:hypothetical protein
MNKKAEKVNVVAEKPKNVAKKVNIMAGNV